MPHKNSIGSKGYQKSLAIQKDIEERLLQQKKRNKQNQKEKTKHLKQQKKLQELRRICVEVFRDSFKALPWKRAFITFDLGPIFKAIQSDLKTACINGIEVSVESLRLKTMLFGLKKQNLFCSGGCGIQANFFAVEKNCSASQAVYNHFHLNLYGYDKDQVEVLFTQDHTVARGLGGLDILENTTLMCHRCNNKKSIHEGKEAQQRQKKVEENRTYAN